MSNICKLVHALDEPNSNYDGTNEGIIAKLKVVIDLLEGSPDEQRVLKKEIDNLINNPDEINNCFK